MEISQQQREFLEDLLSHEGFLIYQEMLKEVLAEQLECMRDAKTWEEFVKWNQRADLLERRIMGLVQEELYGE